MHFWQSGNFRFLSEKEIAMSNRENNVHRRPKLKLLGHDGNIFSIMADASRILKQNGQEQEAGEMIGRVKKSGDYYQALHIISEYVETELSSSCKEPGQKGQKEIKGRRDGDCR